MTQLVGRDDVITAIRERMMRVVDGSGSIVLVRGAAGIGKSRLVSEVVAEATAAGLRVGRCELPPGGQHPTPFGALRALLADLEGSIIGRSFHEIAEALDGQSPETADGWVAAVAPVRAIADRVEIDGEPPRPTLLVIEGLHRADRGSISAIVALLRGSLRHAVLVLATTREAAGRDTGAEIEQLALECGEIHTLAEWSRAELREFLSLHVGRVDERLVAHLETDVRGNPLLVQTALRAISTARSNGSGQRPATEADGSSSIADVGGEFHRARYLLHRLFEGDDDHAAVARVVSAFRRFSLTHLDVVVDHSELPEGRVAAAFDRLVADGWLVPDDRGRFLFRHEIVRAACYEDLGPARRRRIHLAVADRLLSNDEETHSQWWLLELATHVAHLATPGNMSAVRLLTMAATSSAADDPAAAARWYELALDLLPPGSRDHAELRAVQAKELWAAALPAEAADAGWRALVEMRPGEERDAIVPLVADSLAAAGLVEEAIDILDSQGSDDARAPSLAARSAHFLGLVGRTDDADRIYAETVSSLDDPDVDRTTTLVHLAHYARLRGRCADVQELLERLRRSLDAADPPRAEIAEVVALLQTGPGFVDAAARSLDAVHTAGPASVSSGGGGYLVALTQNQWLRGDWDGALESAALAVIACQEHGFARDVAFVRSLAASILVHRGQIGRARRELESIDEPPEAHRPVVLWASALVHEAQGDADRALEELGTARALGDSGLAFWRHLVLSHEAELRIERADRLAADVVGDLVAWSQSGSDPWARHLALRARASLVEDPVAAEEAKRIAERERLAFDIARSRLVLTRLGVEPEENLAEAVARFERLGADPWLRSAARLTRELGLRVRPRARRRAGPLSEAEARIASLVQEGLTNRQIATGLHYSVKTIEAYLTRIYTKTGCQSRLELARAMDTGRVATVDRDAVDLAVVARPA